MGGAGGGTCPMIRGGQSRQVEGTVQRIKAEMNLEISRKKEKACSWGRVEVGVQRVRGERSWGRLGEVEGTEATEPSRGHIM